MFGCRVRETCESWPEGDPFQPGSRSSRRPGGSPTPAVTSAATAPERRRTKMARAIQPCGCRTHHVRARDGDVLPPAFLRDHVFEESCPRDSRARTRSAAGVSPPRSGWEDEDRETRALRLAEI